MNCTTTLEYLLVIENLIDNNIFMTGRGGGNSYI